MNAALDEAVALQKRIDVLVEKRDGLKPKSVKDASELQSLEKDFERLSMELVKLRKQVGRAIDEETQRVYEERAKLDQQVQTLQRAQRAVLDQNSSSWIKLGYTELPIT